MCCVLKHHLKEREGKQLKYNLSNKSLWSAKNMFEKCMMEKFIIYNKYSE